MSALTWRDILAGEAECAEGYYAHRCRKPAYWLRQGHPDPYEAARHLDMAIAQAASQRGWSRVKIWCALQSSVGGCMGDSVPTCRGKTGVRWAADLREWAHVWLDTYNVRIEAGEGEQP